MFVSLKKYNEMMATQDGIRAVVDKAYQEMSRKSAEENWRLKRELESMREEMRQMGEAVGVAR